MSVHICSFADVCVCVCVCVGGGGGGSACFPHCAEALLRFDIVFSLQWFSCFHGDMGHISDRGGSVGLCCVMSPSNVPQSEDGFSDGTKTQRNESKHLEKAF